MWLEKSKSWIGSTQSYVWSWKRLSIAVSLAVACVYYAQYDKKPETECQNPNDAIPCVDFEGKKVNIRSNVQDWKKYTAELADVLTQDMNIEEKAIFRWIVEALIEQESNWEYNASSKTSARGLGQLTSIIFQDAHQYHRKWHYEKAFRIISENKPELFEPLPNSIKGALNDYLQNSTDEKWAEFLARLRYYAYSAKEVDPHSNLLMAIIYYQICYNQLNIEQIEDVFKRVSSATRNTEYRLPDQFRYGPKLQSHIAALYNYNGNKTEINPEKYPWLQERDTHAARVIQKFYNNNYGKK